MSAASDRKAAAAFAKEHVDSTKVYGDKSISLGSESPVQGAISTGIMALDYATGIGGWPRGMLTGIFGDPEIGKSTTLGFAAIREAQKLGLYCAIIAVEPHFDNAWAEKHGVNTDGLLIARPKDGREAFDMLLRYVESPADFGVVIFDSIGGILAPSELEMEGKAKQGGQAGLITWGVKRVLKPAYDKGTVVLMMNQVRDDMNSMHPGVVKQPGGHALEHHERIICHLRRVSGKASIFKEKIDGDEIIVGRQLVAHLVKNQVAEGTGQKGIFDFYAKEVEGLPFGIDKLTDVTNTALRFAVIERSGAWFTTPDGKRFQGMVAVKEHLAAHPAVVDSIREKVMNLMSQRARKPKLEAVPDAE